MEHDRPSATSSSANPERGKASDFQQAYRDGLFAMMHLDFCDRGSSSDGDAVRKRWSLLNQLAHRKGLADAMEAAQKHFERAKSTRRYDTSCPNGLQESVRLTNAALDKLAAALKITPDS